MLESCFERASHCARFHMLLSRSLTVVQDTRLFSNKPYCYLVVNSLMLIYSYQTTHQTVFDATVWPEVDPSVSNLISHFSVWNRAGHRIFFMGEGKVRSSASDFRPFNLHFFDPEADLVITAESPKSSSLSLWGADIAGNVSRNLVIFLLSFVTEVV